MVAGGPKLELKVLYPSYINHASVDGWHGLNFTNRTCFMQILKLSIIHNFYLSDLFGVDKSGSIEINWVLNSYDDERQLKLRVRPPGSELETSYWVWSSANWLEREIWEMFGVRFINHPDLRRLLTDYGFRGHPMCKNFPVSGYSQLSYSERQKRIVSVKTDLAQEFREFNFKSPWLS